jgi:NAD(P)-dependent dehydrogenase (short-subunit alcohol dehydrogenase family)
MAGMQQSKFNGKELLKNAKCVVTGAGLGIGRQIGYTLAEQGASVGVLDYKEELAQSASDLINEKFGPDAAFPLVADVSSVDALKQAFDQVENRFAGSLDLFINNAGILHPCRIEDITQSHEAEMLDRIININQKAAYYCAAFSYPLLLKGKDPLFLLMGSCASAGSEGQGAYAGTKGALRGLMGTLVKEWRGTDDKQPVRVGLIEPDYFETTGLRSEQYLKNLAHARRTTVDNIGNDSVARKSVPLGREGRLVEVGEGVVMMALATYANGEVLVLSGGKSVRI